MILRTLSALLGVGALLAQVDPQALLKQAGADLDAGRFAAAIKGSLTAAKLFQTSGDANNRASALTHAGLAEMYSGDYATALEHFTDALQIARQTHEFGSEIARLNDLGNAYYFQGRYVDAMERYEEAKRRVDAVPNDRWTAWGRQITTANIAILFQTLGQYDRALSLYTDLLNSRQSLPPQEQAQLLMNAGVLQRRLGDPQKALATYRSAQALYQKEAHRDGEIAVLNNIGIVQAMDLRDLTAAAATFTSALRLAEQSGDRPLVVHARLYRGEAFYRAGRLTESSADFQAAADDSAKLGEKEEEWKALYGLARMTIASGDVAGSKPLLERSVKVIESLRAGAGPPSLRSAFLADKRDVYDSLIENTTDVGESFRWMEESRARTLRDRRPSSTLSLSDVARSLPPDTAVLEYWLGGDSAAVVWASANTTGMRRWRTTAKDRDAMAALPALLANPKNNEWRTAAQSVAQQLLSGIPVLEDPAIRQLLIVPDGLLARIPFEVLPLHDSEPLVKHFAVSYSPSASAVPVLNAERGIRWPWQVTFEGFADPVPGATSRDMEIASSRGFQRLPEASREVHGIASILGGTPVLHVGADARKDMLGTAVSAPVLHFATHAYVDQQNPDLSYILLAPAKPSQRFDYLFQKEVYRLQLDRVSLVTLSACETNIGKLVAGEGAESLTQAFLAAGAPSVVTSLWSVGDQSTAELMLRFYSQLAAGESKGNALRKAKLDFLASPAAAHPAYWAAFVLTGSSNSRLPFVIRWTWLAGGVVIVLAGLFLLGTVGRHRWQLERRQKRRDRPGGLIARNAENLHR